MLAIETSQSALPKRSIFRRFSRRDKEETIYLTHPLAPVSGYPRPAPRKLQRRPLEAPACLPTPPASPKQNVISRSEAAKPRQLQMITHIHRVEIPPKYQTVRDPSKRHPSNDPPLRVLPTAMPTIQFPGTPCIRPWDVFLPPSQIFSLYLGFLPQEMSEKWFIYSEGPDQTGKLKVHFHRSWTGMKIAELFVVMDVRGEGAGKILGIKWDGSAETNRMNEEEAKFMIRTTCKCTLGVDLEQRN